MSAKDGTACLGFRTAEDMLKPADRDPERGKAERSDPELAEATATARWIYRLRGRRLPAFGASVFAEPGWDLLLDLYISHAEGRRLSITAACIGSRASTATAIRYVGLLCDAGILRRTADECDQRRSFVELTEHGWTIMTDLLLD